MAKDLRLEYQSLFIKAFQNASIGMTIVSPEGDWLKVNPAFCQFRLVGVARACDNPFRNPG